MHAGALVRATVASPTSRFYEASYARTEGAGSRQGGEESPDGPQRSSTPPKRAFATLRASDPVEQANHRRHRRTLALGRVRQLPVGGFPRPVRRRRLVVQADGMPVAESLSEGNEPSSPSCTSSTSSRASLRPQRTPRTRRRHRRPHLQPRQDILSVVSSLTKRLIAGIRAATGRVVNSSSSLTTCTSTRKSRIPATESREAAGVLVLRKRSGRAERTRRLRGQPHQNGVPKPLGRGPRRQAEPPLPRYVGLAERHAPHRRELLQGHG